MNFIVAEDTTKRVVVFGVIYVTCAAKKTEIILKKIGAESSAIQSSEGGASPGQGEGNFEIGRQELGLGAHSIIINH